jgi:hypothetical protein
VWLIGSATVTPAGLAAAARSLILTSAVAAIRISTSRFGAGPGFEVGRVQSSAAYALPRRRLSGAMSSARISVRVLMRTSVL